MNQTRKIFGWLISATVPYILIMLSIRLLFTPLFLVVEYNFPGFPEDPYGFSTRERLKYGSVSIQYLFNNEGPEFLQSINFEDGSPIYNEREVSHMLDVKNLLQTTLLIFYGLVVLHAIIIGLSWRNKALKQYWHDLSNGGWATIILIATIIFAVVISFDQLFTAFHKVFFTGDTWLFYFSDTLIRLFPMRLWQDAFIMMGVITLLFAFFLAIFGRRKSHAV